jgi:cell division protein FtsQ
VSGNVALKLTAWAVALTLVALPIVGVLNGWFAGDRWPVTKLAVRAEFNHVSAEQIRAAATPLLGQGFFALRLDTVRDAVAKLPWVERVEARKRWPDSLDLVVYEQQPYARWGEERLINRRGEIFSVAGTSNLQGLPRLSGPDDRLPEVLQFYADCLKEFSGSGLVIDAVSLSQRGGWRLDLASGAVLELGRDSARPRLQRFLDVWPRLAGARPAPPAYVDLRYENGFAVRWAEPATASPAESGKKPPAGANASSPHAAAGLATRLPESRWANPESRLFAYRIPNPESRVPALP